MTKLFEEADETFRIVMWVDGVQHFSSCRVVDGMQGYRFQMLNSQLPLCMWCREAATRHIVES